MTSSTGKNTLSSKVFTRILGIQVGNKVGFIDMHNVPKYGIVVESERGMFRIHFYHKRIQCHVVRCESEVKLIE